MDLVELIMPFNINQISPVSNPSSGGGSNAPTGSSSNEPYLKKKELEAFFSGEGAAYENVVLRKFSYAATPTASGFDYSSAIKNEMTKSLDSRFGRKWINRTWNQEKNQGIGGWEYEKGPNGEDYSKFVERRKDPLHRILRLMGHDGHKMVSQRLSGGGFGIYKNLLWTKRARTTKTFDPENLFVALSSNGWIQLEIAQTLVRHPLEDNKAPIIQESIKIHGFDDAKKSDQKAAAEKIVQYFILQYCERDATGQPVLDVKGNPILNKRIKVSGGSDAFRKALSEAAAAKGVELTAPVETDEKNLERGLGKRLAHGVSRSKFGNQTKGGYTALKKYAAGTTVGKTVKGSADAIKSEIQDKKTKIRKHKETISNVVAKHKTYFWNP